ncbi:addiction module toxin, HicA family [Chitinophaga sp. SYP-B3965]|uniref:type II toxin-antitoxin system HicA family toxin n=1 Tax=Chitinophaga sp. SYP-B3965 TaxID=2663120 RepID=UPI001299C719|nr:type II toxin-antitoxin system HicA family toxin [Chitinophaga sp. SYP-B3965]MRG45353.1 addiction module toxin, HicA family [Chitinophaga sp. SYP-B3965]
MTYKNLLQILKTIGFIKIATMGSHVMLQHPNYPQRITIPLSSSKKEIPAGTLAAIKKIVIEAGIISKEELNKQLLINSQ